jgi:tetratricopeptide (TPR) repeat protein
LPPALRDRIEGRWYLSIAYMELGGLLWNAGNFKEGLQFHRNALSAFLENTPPAWLQDPAKQDHLSHLQRELALSLWLYLGISPEAMSAANGAVQAVENCSEPNCRMRHAQSQGTLGEMQWAAANKEQGIATLRKAVGEFEDLAADDPANAVYKNAGAQLRAYLALALAGTPEAVSLAERNLQLAHAGADANLYKGRQRAMIYRIVLGAALSGVGRHDEAEHQLRATLADNRDWNANDDLKWSALHELVKTLEAQHKTGEAVTASQQGQTIAEGIPKINFGSSVLQAVAARDYASAVAHWPASTVEQREKARKLLDSCCSLLDERYGSLAGALLEFPPHDSERAALQKLLAR